MCEADNYQIPQSLSRLFATLLVYCNPANPKELWQTFEYPMSEDFLLIPNIQTGDIHLLILDDINNILHSIGHK